MIFGRYINKYYFKYLLGFLLGAIALIAVDVVQLQIPEIIGDIIDGLKDNVLTKDALLDSVLKMFIIALIMFVGRFGWRVCIFGNAVKIEADMRREMFNKIELVSQEYLGKNKTGALMAYFTNDLETIKQCFASGLLMLIDTACLGIIAFYKMFVLDWQLTLIACIPLVLLGVAATFIGKAEEKRSKANHDAFGELSDFAQESFSGITVIKAFVKEAKEIHAFVKYNKKNMDTTIALVKFYVIFEILLTLVLSGIILTIMGFGAYYVYLFTSDGSGAFTVGDLTEFVAYFDTLIWPMFAIGELINISSQGRASLKRINTLMDTEIEINDNLVDDNKITRGEKVEGYISFKNFNFAYPSNPDKLVLKDINIEIEKGKMIGIIGRTGSGKTTLVQSLLRLYNVNEGSIFIDGVDIMHAPLKKVREAISFVPQDNFLFSNKIEDNIAFYSNEVVYDDIAKAAEAADVEGDILEFSNKYETILGERGVTVSGGQRQRISIARALIKNAPILILDDSVSAVDTKTEEIILNNLRELRKGMTTIIIAHRVSTLETLDKIIVIDDGEVIGYASHEELVSTNEFYKKQVELQKLEDEVGAKDEL